MTNLTEQEHKELATKVMGWKVVLKTPRDNRIYSKKEYFLEIVGWGWLKDFNPEQGGNAEQFLEVLGKLNLKQENLLRIYLYENSISFRYLNHEIDAIKWITKPENRTTVLRGVLEVIKGIK